MDFINSFIYNPWVVGIGVTIIAGLVLYFIFGIGKEKQHRKAQSRRMRSTGRLSNRTIVLTANDRKKHISLPINVSEFNKISSRISLSAAENTTWRVGYYLFKNTSPKKEYVFHVYQDKGSNAFHSRIVEIETGVRDIEPDYSKHNVGIEDTKRFKLSIEKKDDKLFFYVDRIPLGNYNVPFETIDDLTISAWSHEEHPPITITIKDILWS